MKKLLLVTTLVASSLMAGTALASKDCQDPVADWQPKENLSQMLETAGWTVNRIKVDDGCYEIKGYDQQNNKIKAEYYPATLRLRKFEIEFDKDALIPDHLPSK